MILENLENGVPNILVDNAVVVEPVDTNSNIQSFDQVQISNSLKTEGDNIESASNCEIINNEQQVKNKVCDTIISISNIEYDNGIDNKKSVNETVRKVLECDTNGDKKKDVDNTKILREKNSKINIVSNILLIPEPIIKENKKKREYVSSVLTCERWLANAERKEQDKLNILRKKEENKKRREENKQKRMETEGNKKKKQKMSDQEQQKEKILVKESIHDKENTLNENKEIKHDSETTLNEKKMSQQEHENDTVLEKECRHDSEKTLNENRISEQEQKKEKLSENENIHHTENILNENSYVIVQYENSFYPGKISKINGNEYTVTSMTKALNHWKWPEKKDELVYEKDDVMQVISTPKKVTSRGTYSVPEMTNYIINI